MSNKSIYHGAIVAYQSKTPHVLTTPEQLEFFKVKLKYCKYHYEITPATPKRFAAACSILGLPGVSVKKICYASGNDRMIYALQCDKTATEQKTE